jgi:hypothetical protein
MTFARSTACLVASAFVFAACSKPPAAGDGQAAMPANNPASHTASASDTAMPDMKPGLWEVKMTHHGGDGQTHGGVIQQCLDAAAMAQAKLTAASYMKANCSKNETQRAGDTWTNDLVCKSGGSVTTTHTVTAMVGDGAYHTDLRTTYDPPLAGSANSTTVMDGKWISACKPT